MTAALRNSSQWWKAMNYPDLPSASIRVKEASKPIPRIILLAWPRKTYCDHDHAITCRLRAPTPAGHTEG